MLLPTFPLYVSELGGGEKIVGVLGGLYALAAVFIRPCLSKLADEKGRKYVLLISIFAAVTGPLLYLINLGFLFLAFARIYHAISLAGFITASQTMVADLSKPEKRGTMIGIYGIVSGVAMAIAPALGFLIIENMGFSALFMIAAVTAMGAIPCVFMLNEPQLTKFREEIGTTVPLVNIVRNRWVLIPSIALFVTTMIQGATNTFLPLHGISVGIVNVGIFFVVYSITSLIARVFAGFLSDKIGRKNLALPALLLTGAGTLCLTRLPSMFMLVLGGGLIGFGFSTTHTALLALIIDKTSIRERSQAVSFYANAFDVGVSTGSMVLGPVAGYSYTLLWVLLSLVVFIGFVVTAKALPTEDIITFAGIKKENA